MKTAVIGGGAAGFFLAVNLKEAVPEMAVTIFERSNRVLSKVAVSGGGALQLHEHLCRCA
jgi:predicted flavoprotein YhiN